MQNVFGNHTTGIKKIIKNGSLPTVVGGADFKVLIT